MVQSSDSSCLQELGWFDREENASGALSSRLSADTAAIRGALGDQLGLMVQNLVTFAGVTPSPCQKPCKKTFAILTDNRISMSHRDLMEVSSFTNAPAGMVSTHASMTSC